MKIKSELKSFLFIIFILAQSSQSGFLQFDSKSNCPNTPISSLGILISLSETDMNSMYGSTLSQEDRKSYEEVVSLKRSFASTMSYIPQSFSPEKEEYWNKLDYLVVIFVIIAVFPIIFIVFYLIMRFVLKKCVGPTKVSKVHKVYRNLTWLIMGLSTIATVVLFSIVLGKSVAVGNNIETTFNFANERISESDGSYEQINEVVEKYRSAGKGVPTVEFMAKFKNDIETYITNTKERTKQILEDDSKRTNIVIAIYVVYMFLVALAYVFFFFRLEKLECILSIILFFAVPGFIILEGYNAKFFFYYGDMCDSVHGALYANELPVADQALGYYYNCFPRDTKAALYNIRYRLYESLDDNFREDYDNLHNKTLNNLFNCQIVVSVIPKIEADFCKESLDHMYTLITLLTWIILTSLGVAIGARRLEVLIWKKRNEIESMIQNQEVLY